MQMLKSKRLSKSPSNIFIFTFFSLCCSDMLIGSACVLTRCVLVNSLLGSPLDIHPMLSWFSAYVAYVAYNASAYQVIVIGIDRAIATTQGVKYRDIITVRRSVVCSVIGWMSIVFVAGVSFSARVSRVLMSGEQVQTVDRLNIIMPIQFDKFVSMPVFLGVILTCKASTL